MDFEVTKIRHVLPPGGYEAVYATASHPFHSEIYLSDRCLVNVSVTDDNGTQSHTDTLVGYVPIGGFTPAPQLESHGYYFVGYIHRHGLMDEALINRVMNYAAQAGQQIAASNTPPQPQPQAPVQAQVEVPSPQFEDLPDEVQQEIAELTSNPVPRMGGGTVG